MSSPSAPEIGLRFRIPDLGARWRLETEDVPETPLHDAIIQLLLLVLGHRFAGREPAAMVTSNLGCRWDPSDARVGTDPDVVVLQPAPPEGERLTTLRVWEPGHHPPRLAVEVVSANTAEKDYLDAPARCARLGVEEVWVFDPLLEGPSSTGGPYTLQVWRRSASGAGADMEQIHAGPTPAFSPLMDAWLVTTDGGYRLRVSDDAEGQRLWPTRAEAAEAEIARLRTLLGDR